MCCSEAAILLVLRQRLRWYLLQHTATSHCMQHTTATHCNTLLHRAATHYCNTLQHTTTHCNTLQHTTTHCNTLRCAEAEAAIVPAATHGCIALQHTTATHCNTLPCAEAEVEAALHCNTPSTYTAATHYNTLQRTTTHCNTPETVLEANAERMVGTLCAQFSAHTLLRHTATQ